MTKLNLTIIEGFNLPKENYTPDWDDSGYKFKLPSGLTLSGLYRCNNSPTEMDILEGLDGYICIQTKEELEELIALTYDQILEWVKIKDPEFKIEDYN